MAKKEFTASEVMVLQKQLQDGIKAIGEQYLDIQKNIANINGRLDKIDARLDKIDARLDKTDKRLDKIDDNIEIIKFSLHQKADRVELEAIEKRVMALEKKFA